MGDRCIEAFVPIDRHGTVRRTGVLLRLLSLPYGKYDVRISGDTSSILESRSMGLDELSALRLAVKVISDNATPRRCSTIHGFFWYFKATRSRNLILETDQSPSQFFTNYLNMKIPLMPIRSLYGKSTIVTWTNWSKSGFIKDGFSEDAVKIIPPPYVPEVMRIGAKPKEKAVMFVGYDFERKGGDLALAIFKGIKSIDPTVKLIYIGKVPYGRVPPYVDEYYPVLSRGRLLDKMARVKVLLMPSRHDAYGFTAMEAMANGVVVVSSDREGLGEFVSSNGGVICGVDDISCFMENTLRYLEDRWFVQRSRIQQEMLKQNNDLEIIREKVSGLYEEFARK